MSFNVYVIHTFNLFPLSSVDIIYDSFFKHRV